MAYLNEAVNPGVESFILDSEVVAWDTENKSILPFQKLSTRSKKDVNLKDVKVQVILYAFDMIYKNGKSLLQESFQTRRDNLYVSFTMSQNFFCIAVHSTFIHLLVVPVL